MVKILMVCNNLRMNGISSVIMNYISNIDMTNLQIDIFAGEPINPEYVAKLEKMGCGVIGQKNRKKSPFLYYFNLVRTLRCNSYDCVHVHTNSCTCIIELLIAKILKVKKRIPHCHNTICDHENLNILLYPLFSVLYTNGIACSDAAGRHLFRNRPYTVLNNGIDIERYSFDTQSRIRYREKFGITLDSFVLGHVGLFNEQKNHTFLIDLFYEYKKINDDSVLLLLGEGPLLEKIQMKVSNLGLDSSVIFAGSRSDINNIYNVMDVFLLPSLWEGLPLVILEAQANALPILAADTITTEAKCCSSTEFISLQDKDRWITAIEEAKNKQYDRTRDCFKDLTSRGFNIKNEVNKLKSLYEG